MLKNTRYCGYNDYKTNKIKLNSLPSRLEQTLKHKKNLLHFLRHSFEIFDSCSLDHAENASATDF